MTSTLVGVVGFFCRKDMIKMLLFEVSLIFNIGVILLLGFIIGLLFNKIRIPGLCGMILVGILIGPVLSKLGIGFYSISDSLSASLRQIALVIVLTRSGLNLDLKTLRRIGRPAILMCFIPATFEMIAVALSSHILLDLSLFEGILLGSVLAAVSPAVVSPRMIRINDEGYGINKGAPKLVLAGSSCDDIYVIVMFYTFLGIVENKSMNSLNLALVPINIILGIVIGIGAGLLLGIAIRRIKGNVEAIIIMIATSFILIGFEEFCKNYTKIDPQALLSILVMAIVVLYKAGDKAIMLSNGYNKLWKAFEIILFVLVGASLSFDTITLNNVFYGFIILILGLIFRLLGTYLCLIGTNFNNREKIFCIISYIPKATVQASIGGIALSMGLGCGGVILSIAVLSILITAPIGAILIDNLYKRLLTYDVLANDESYDKSI